MARHLGLQRTGNQDIVFDMHEQHQDPCCGAFIDQVLAYRKCVCAWPEALQSELQKSWQHYHQLLDSVKHLATCQGPLAALQCYLREHGREHDRFDQWSKPGHNGLPAWEIHLQNDWLSTKQQLKEVQKINKHVGRCPAAAG